VQINVRTAALGDSLLKKTTAHLRTGRGSPPEPDDPPHELTWILTGGEDHSLVATFPPGTALPARWKLIGEVRPGHGVLVDGHPWTGTPGWDHFR
jgi:thiamine monophosphate kinase